jgi:hypothetical protein
MSLWRKATARAKNEGPQLGTKKTFLKEHFFFPPKKDARRVSCRLFNICCEYVETRLPVSDVWHEQCLRASFLS